MLDAPDEEWRPFSTRTRPLIAAKSLPEPYLVQSLGKTVDIGSYLIVQARYIHT